MDEEISVLKLDDFEVIAERARLTQAIAALTDRYRQLNQEMTRRETLQWMARGMRDVPAPQRDAPTGLASSAAHQPPT
jgi:hypothetical protein